MSGVVIIGPIDAEGDCIKLQGRIVTGNIDAAEGEIIALDSVIIQDIISSKTNRYAKIAVLNGNSIAGIIQAKYITFNDRSSATQAAGGMVIVNHTLSDDEDEQGKVRNIIADKVDLCGYAGNIQSQNVRMTGGKADTIEEIDDPDGPITVDVINGSVGTINAPNATVTIHLPDAKIEETIIAKKIICLGPGGQKAEFTGNLPGDVLRTLTTTAEFMKTIAGTMSYPPTVSTGTPALLQLTRGTSSQR